MKIIEFIRPRKMFPTIFFTDGNLKDEYEKLEINERIIKKILEEACEYDVAEKLKIYPMNYLLFFLKFFAAKEKELKGDEEGSEAFASLESAEEEFQREQIDFEFFTVSWKLNFLKIFKFMQISGSVWLSWFSWCFSSMLLIKDPSFRLHNC